MAGIQIKHYKVLSLPKKPDPNVVYYVLDQASGEGKAYITDLLGVLVPLITFNSEDLLTYDDIEDLEVLVKPLEFTFNNRSSVSITHNLNRVTIVTVLDTMGNEITTDVFHHETLNEVTVSFGFPSSGKLIIR